MLRIDDKTGSSDLPVGQFVDRGGTWGTVIARSVATKQSIPSLRGKMDCFAEPVIGRAFARPVGCVPSMIGSLEVKVFYPA